MQLLARTKCFLQDGKKKKNSKAVILFNQFVRLDSHDLTCAFVVYILPKIYCKYKQTNKKKGSDGDVFGVGVMFIYFFFHEF